MVINQYHTIGDLIFIEPLCRYFYHRDGRKPILPIHDHLMWIQEYIDTAVFVPKSTFELNYESIEIDNSDYLPLLFANQILRKLDKFDYSDYENVMLDKYRLALFEDAYISKEYRKVLDLWKTIDLRFDVEKGHRLYEHLKLEEDEEYILINEHSRAGKIEINLKDKYGIKIIKMEAIEGYTVIDWWKVIVAAKENHHISTSTFFIMQALYNKFGEIFDSEVFLYPRPGEDGLRGIKNLIPSFKCKKLFQNT
jgi:hypothetical protein